MENIATDLKVSELRQGDLCKSYEELRSQASNVLLFSLQWKDLESHFDSTRESLRAGLENLSEREKGVAFKEKELEARESRLDSDFAVKDEELARIEKLIEESSKEVELNRQHLDSVKSLIEENREELEAKERQYEAIQKSIAERDKEFHRIQSCLEEEEAQFESVKNSLKAGDEKLLVLERRVKQKSEEVEWKEKELDSVRKTLRGYKDDIQLKDRKFNGIRRSIEERKKEVELKEEQLRVCLSTIDECDKEIILKEEKLNAINNSIDECSNDLDAKEKRLEFVQKDVELKEKSFLSLKNFVDQCALKFERKEREIEGLLKELELKEKSCDSKVEEVNLIHNRINDSLNEIELRAKNVEKRSRALQTKERQFRKRVNEFELREKESTGSSQKPTEVRANENAIIPHSQAKIEQLEHAHINGAIFPSSVSNQNLITGKGKDLQLLLNQHLGRHDSVCSEVFNVFRVSTDPAKLVLDAMEGFYPSTSSEKASEFDVNIVRRSCILLLEQLMKASPQIGPQVKEEAMKLASEWMAKMSAKDNYLEALGIWQFLTSYRLATAFDSTELRRVLDVVGQHGQSTELRKALSSAYKAPAATVTPKIEEGSENSLADIMTSSSSDLAVDIPNLLRTSTNQAKDVLDYFQGWFSQHWKTGTVGVEANVMGKCIFLFEQLLRISPQITSVVKEDAMKLAMEWKANINVDGENAWVILGFLQFLHTYGLVSSFDIDEILKLLETISQQEDVLGACRNCSFADEIPEFIQSLIQRKKPIDAVRLICAFKLTNKFPPVPLLTEYMKDMKDTTTRYCKVKRPLEKKEKATNEEIGSLEAVIKCVQEHALDLSELSVAQISQRIRDLERVKKQRRESALLQPKAEHGQKPHNGKQQAGKKRSSNEGDPQRERNKFPRTSSSRQILHCPPPAFIPVVTQPGLASHSPFGRSPRQFSLGGSSNMVGPSFGAPRRY